MISRLRRIRSARQAQQAPSPGLNTGPTNGKMPDGWASSHGVPAERCRRFTASSRCFEVIAREHDREVAGASRDANAERAERRGQRRLPLDVDRLEMDGAALEVLLRDVERQAEARPVCGCGCGRIARGGDEIAAVDHAPERFLDRFGGKGSRELAEDVAIAPARADRGRERTGELAVEKELAVLGVEADDVRRQHVDAEIRRELRNVLAVLQGDRIRREGPS